MSKPKLYVGCSLTQASLEFITSVENLKLKLAESFEILDFFGLTDEPDSTKIYNHDRKCVLNSDIFLAICDFPSTGLGMEIGFAIENQKNIVIAYNSKSKITRMVLGIPATSKLQFCQYQDMSEIEKFLENTSNLNSTN